MIEVKNVIKTYGKKGQRFTALDNVSLIIPTGASVAIVGKSGSGKSTLMHVMSGLDRPQAGQVIVDGVDILALKSKQVDQFRASKIGFVFQSFFVQGNETVESNVSLPLEINRTPARARAAKIRQALKGVELYDKLKVKAKNLSGGQKQRLAVARAIASNPSILFADEPTGNLDSITSRNVEDLLFDYNRQTSATLIIVTHDEELAARCDLQLHVKDGRITDVLE